VCNERKNEENAREEEEEDVFVSTPCTLKKYKKIPNPNPKGKRRLCKNSQRHRQEEEGIVPGQRVTKSHS